MSTSQATLRRGPHPVWSIAEVVREIMLQINESWDALASCARVSRAFSEPALEALWWKLSGLGPLFSLLRKSVKRLDYDPGNSGLSADQYVFTGPIDDLEWVRFQHYANLVRMYETFSEKIDGLTTAILLDKMAGRPLLPRLIHLAWYRPDQNSSAFLLFISPTLKSVAFSFGRIFMEESEPIPETQAHDYAAANALRLIYSRAPYLRRLDVNAGHACAVGPIPSFTDLHTLRLTDVRDPSVVYTACHLLTRLRRLEVTTMRHDPNPPAATSAAPRLTDLPLPIVTNLSLQGDSELLAPLLDSLRAPQLRELRMTMDFEDEPWQRCMQIIPRFAATLRDINISMEDADLHEDMEALDFADLYAPLYALRAIRDVSLSADVTVVITAEDVAAMAKAWPELRNLMLPSRYTQDFFEVKPEQETPITALEIFAKECRNLERVIMAIPNATPLDNIDVTTVPTYVNRVRDLRLFAGSWPERLQEKAELYLRHIFPLLEDREIMYDPDDDWL